MDRPPTRESARTGEGSRVGGLASDEAGLAACGPADHEADDNPADHEADDNPADHEADDNPADHESVDNPADHESADSPSDSIGGRVTAVIAIVAAILLSPIAAGQSRPATATRAASESMPAGDPAEFTALFRFCPEKIEGLILISVKRLPESLNMLGHATPVP